MSDRMDEYYRYEDRYKGWVCTLTNKLCGDNCTKCVFAKTAFEKDVMKKATSDHGWYTVFGIRNDFSDDSVAKAPFTFLGQCNCRHDAIECKRRNRDKFDRVIVVNGMASPADLFDIMEEVD